MNRVRTRLAPVVSAAAALAIGLLALGVPSQGAAQRPIHVGTYEAAPKTQGQYSVGEWSVVKKHGHYRLAAHPEAGGIYYPDAQKCGGITTPPLAKATYPIGANGSFLIKETVQSLNKKQQPLAVHVKWYGHWTTRRTVSGTITLSIPGKCQDRRHWTGNAS